MSYLAGYSNRESAGDGTEDGLCLLYVESKGALAKVVDYRTHLAVEHRVRLPDRDYIDDGVVVGDYGRFWGINSLSTRLMQMEAPQYIPHVIRIREYETEHGGLFPSGAIALNKNHLLICHSQGAMIVDSTGKTLTRVAKRKPDLYKLSTTGTRRLRWHSDFDDPADTYNISPGNRLIPVAQNGSFIGAVYYMLDYFVIMDHRLIRKTAYLLDNLHIVSTVPLRNETWLLVYRERRGNSIWSAVVDTSGHLRSPKRLPFTSRYTGKHLCPYAATRSHVWVKLPVIETDSKSTLLFIWDTLGQYLEHPHRLPGSVQILGNSEKSIYLEERVEGHRQLVERDAITLKRLRSWAMPPSSWTVTAGF
jgi:hypothetical protein